MVEVRRLAKENERIAIHAVLENIFLAGVAQSPKTIVELGVSREALANKVLAIVARMHGSDFVSCDLYDFADACDYLKWQFVRSDDIEFAHQFLEFCFKRRIDPLIDLLFIDTDEIYGHVKWEIECWFPHLRQECTVMFRCTNLQKILYYPDGKTTPLGWNNERGVIRALTEYLGTKFDETKEWSGKINGWKIDHFPWGAGLTIMRRI